MDVSRFHHPQPKQKRIEDLPRDSLHTLVVQQTWNKTRAPVIGLHINKQIFPPKIPVHNRNVVHEPAKNISVRLSHKVKKLPKYKRFHGKKRFHGNHTKYKTIKK